MRIAKGAKTVATIRLDKAQLDPSVAGPRKGVPALKVTDGATTLVLAATEDHAGFVRYASRRAAETKFSRSPVMEVRPTLERDTIVSEARESFLSLNAEAFRVYLEALSMDELADVLTRVEINQCVGCRPGDDAAVLPDAGGPRYTGTGREEVLHDPAGHGV